MTHDFASLNILEFDYLEFAVENIDTAIAPFLRLGFEKHSSREIAERKLKSHLLIQNQIRIVVSQSDDSKDSVNRFVKTHGEGVLTIGLRCRDALSTFELLAQRGATGISPPKTISREFGTVTEARIRAFGDVEHALISRDGGLVAEGFEVPLKTQCRGHQLERIDHVTSNVSVGEREKCVEFYERVFGLKNTRFFDIHTDRTGLYSNVMQSPDGVIKMPFNEPTDPNSQIQEFLNVNHGPGIQHVALATNDIISSLRPLKREGNQFLETPATYYEDLVKRLPGITENRGELEELGIQLDGDSSGYLLQIFSQNVVGPFFFEVIQRKGNDGFGEGNFKALFEAIERDQVRRGILT